MRILNSSLRFPDISLVYETEVSTSTENQPHDICIAIPRSPKYFAWITSSRGKQECLILEVCSGMRATDLRIYASLAIPHVEHNIKETVLYGSIIPAAKIIASAFIVEDVYVYDGRDTARNSFVDKFGMILRMMQTGILQTPLHSVSGYCVGFNIAFMLPHIANIGLANIIGAREMQTETNYPIHKYQYRSAITAAPYLIRTPAGLRGCDILTPDTKTITDLNVIEPIIQFKPIIPNPRRGQYKNATIFLVRADTRQDVYHLYARNRHGSLAYYNTAGVQTLKTSRFLNSLFRSVRENTNLDLAEESEDEDTFQNVSETKYLSPNKEFELECVFDTKIAQWVPIRKAPPGTRVVQLSALI